MNVDESLYNHFQTLSPLHQKAMQDLMIDYTKSFYHVTRDRSHGRTSTAKRLRDFNVKVNLK